MILANEGGRMTSLDTLELDDDISRPLDIVLDVVVLVV
jgi:hypothetical protein